MNRKRVQSQKNKREYYWTFAIKFENWDTTFILVYLDSSIEQKKGSISICPRRLFNNKAEDSKNKRDFLKLLNIERWHNLKEKSKKSNSSHLNRYTKINLIYSGVQRKSLWKRREGPQKISYRITMWSSNSTSGYIHTRTKSRDKSYLFMQSYSKKHYSQ